MKKNTGANLAPAASSGLVDLDGELLAALLDAAAGDTETQAAPALRDKLLRRVAKSIEGHRELRTVRARDAAWLPLAPGVRARLLHRCDNPAGVRPGEPIAAMVVEVDAGASLPAALDRADGQREWLVLSGDLTLDANGGAEVSLHATDYHVAPAGVTALGGRSAQGARLFVRRGPGACGGKAQTSFGARCAWAPYGPGIVRRVLWTDGPQAAYLIRGDAGAGAPAHGHGHDEECLLLQGDMFLGDILLGEGDYQLAPRGCRHGEHYTDHGVLLYVRGDAELAVGA